jgi:hypothetical protein
MAFRIAATLEHICNIMTEIFPSKLNKIQHIAPYMESSVSLILKM